MDNEGFFAELGFPIDTTDIGNVGLYYKSDFSAREIRIWEGPCLAAMLI